MSLHKPANAPVLQQFSLAGKVALVTGGARGIGLSAARALAEAGATVAITYSTSSAAPKTAEALAAETGARVAAYSADVRDARSIEATVEKVHADYGRLDIVVANAGITSQIAALDYTPEQFREIMRVNLDGAFFTAQAAARAFKKQKEADPAFGCGKIILTGSVSAHLVNLPQRQAAYNASKAGAVHLVKCLAVEWTGFARVNCVSPGFIATDMLDSLPKDYQEKWLDMTPGRRFCDPEELKGAYVFLASDASSYMTGSDIIIDAGYTLP